ncbi:hypothetical protein BG006_004270 [Podila minutissima]|uniref:Uncharacterized protein n=1 Tax=Podila minutissima TaxID=64525 RepID=A0A9P5SQZ8_9FUNG|nr:hypothetical protein BG006_004270 [Podila minutissima]
MVESHGITVKDMLAWNEKLLRDCINLDDDSEKPVCVSIYPGGIKPPRELKAHKAKNLAKGPKPKIQVAPKHITPVAPMAQTKVAELRVDSEDPTPDIA